MYPQDVDFIPDALLLMIFVKKYDVIFEEKYVSFIIDSCNADTLIKKLCGLKIC